MAMIPSLASVMDELRANVFHATPLRILYIAEAFRRGMSVDEIHALSKYDPWFLGRIENIVIKEKEIKEKGFPNSPEGWMT